MLSSPMLARAKNLQYDLMPVVSSFHNAFRVTLLVNASCDSGSAFSQRTLRLPAQALLPFNHSLDVLSASETAGRDSNPSQ